MTRSGGAGRAKPPAARAKPPKTKAKTNEGRWLTRKSPQVPRGLRRHDAAVLARRALAERGHAIEQAARRRRGGDGKNQHERAVEF